jgi:hypothetical protein
MLRVRKRSGTLLLCAFHILLFQCRVETPQPIGLRGDRIERDRAAKEARKDARNDIWELRSGPSANKL